jgi:hypothetical protein
MRFRQVEANEWVARLATQRAPKEGRRLGEIVASHRDNTQYVQGRGIVGPRLQHLARQLLGLLISTGIDVIDRLCERAQSGIKP